MDTVETKLTPFDEIPSAITVNILSRLRTTKSCLNCKLVCKEWYNIIISNEFADLRSARRSYSTMVFHGKFYDNRFDFLLYDLDESSKVDGDGNFTVSDDAMIRFKTNFYHAQYDFCLVNECNGLFCLKASAGSITEWNPYLVCNLLTGERVYVEQQRMEFYSVDIFGLGCCPVSLQYKVVRILRTRKSPEFVKYVAEIQTVGTNEWRVIDDVVDVPLHYGFQCYGPPKVFLHGSLHMYYTYGEKYIWCFNFSNEQFSKVPTPSGTMSDRSSLSIFDSCLCLTSYDRYQCEIWLMKEYGVEASWVKQFVIQQLQLYFAPTIILLVQMYTGELLVSQRRYGLYSNVGTCDDESVRWRRVKIRGESVFISVSPFNTKFSKIT